ncbi:MAG: ISLre2 family transposase [Christensenellales bacterium]
MEDIILQLVVELVGEITSTALECRLNLEKMTPKLLDLLKRRAAEIVQQLINMADSALLADKAGRRKEGWVVERRADKRCVMTQIGEIRYERSYYLNKGTGTYGYPIDQFTGTAPYERVDLSLSKALVSKSRGASYGKAVKDCCEGNLSRQTVLNKIREAEAVIEKPLERRSVAELHIDADEDHVALQDKRQRSRTNVPLISVYEGIEEDGKRHRCKNVFHISAYGKSPDTLWEDVLTQTEQRYDMSDTKVYLHGDGAEWIAKGMAWLPNARFVLDKYHKNKYLRQMLAGYDVKKAHQLYADLNQALYDMDEDYYDNIVGKILAEMPQRAEKIMQAANYLRDHMPDIAIHAKDPSAGNGGATEPHVSHVLSSRLSSRPMGWSKGTLERFVPILANGPEVSFRRKKPPSCPSMAAARAFQTTKCKARAAQRLAAQQGAFPVIQLGKRTELHKLLHAMAFDPAD